MISFKYVGELLTVARYILLGLQRSSSMCMFLVFAWCKIRFVGDPGELRDMVRFLGFGFAACLTILTPELRIHRDSTDEKQCV